MSTFADLSKRLGSVIRSLPKMIDRAVFENQSEIIDLNTAQLSKGKDSLGELLDRYASDSYAAYKKAIGSQAPNGVPDLKLEGDFYEGFYIEKSGDDYLIYSKDEKTNSLVNRYGQSIFGLSDASLKVVVPQILDSLLTQVREKLMI